MSLRRVNPKRDRNEPAIVKALNDCGAITYRLSGTGLPDLLVGWRGVWLLLEVKAPKGRMEPDQVIFHATAKALGLPCYRVNTDEAALDVLGLDHSKPGVKPSP